MSATDNTFIRAGQVAALLEISVARFRKLRPSLEAAHGFPRAMPLGNPQKWRRSSVQQWIDAAEHLPAPTPAGAPDTNATAARRVVMLRQARTR